MSAQQSEENRVFKKIQEVMREHLESDEELKLETALEDDLSFDSIELVELALKLENTFTVKLPIADVRRCVTIADLCELIEPDSFAKKSA